MYKKILLVHSNFSSEYLALSRGRYVDGRNDQVSVLARHMNDGREKDKWQVINGRVQKSPCVQAKKVQFALQWPLVDAFIAWLHYFLFRQIFVLLQQYYYYYKCFHSCYLKIGVWALWCCSYISVSSISHLLLCMTLWLCATRLTQKTLHSVMIFHC